MPKGLRGLPGLNNISEEERKAFMLANENKLRQFRSQKDRERAAEILYNNQLFANKFGKDKFHSAVNGGISYEDRNRILKDEVVNDAFRSAFSPIDKYGIRDDNKGLGKDWEKYDSELSTEGKEALLNSDWKTKEELQKDRFERKWGDTTSVPVLKGIGNTLRDVKELFFGEGIDEYKKNSNQAIIDKIYREDGKKRAQNLSGAVLQTKLNPEITGKSDEETEKIFQRIVTPGSYIDENGMPNMGIPEYAAHLGDGTEKGKAPEMEDFTIDEMREIIAKKAVYDKAMSPEMAASVLNGEAKEYMKDHQSWWRRKGLFFNDLGISVLSYTADKVNGLYNLKLMAEDKWGGEKPLVWVDDEGNVFHPSEHKLVRTKNGYGFYDDNNQFHGAHQTRVARTTLHNMGRDEDGNKLSGIMEYLDPAYWTRAEQFLTLDENEQKQFEKLGASPYSVAWGEDEEASLGYEAFKMTSFGISDGITTLIPFGIGLVGKGLSTASKFGKVGSALGKGINITGRTLSNPILQGTAGAAGIAYAYNRGAFQETLAKNLAGVEEAAVEASRKDVENFYTNNKQYKAQADALIQSEVDKLKAQYVRELKLRGEQIPDDKTLDATVRQYAKDTVFMRLMQDRLNERKNSKEYYALQDEAINSAGNTAVTTFLPEAIKYGLVNTVGFRKFLYTHPTSLFNKAQKTFKGMEEFAVGEGKEATKRMGVKSKFSTLGGKSKQFGKVVASQIWGGTWTNGTDDMMVDAAERINDDSFNRYLNAYITGEPIADVYNFADGMYSYLMGALNSMGQQTTWNAAAVGGLGSLVSASPHLANIASLATKSGREAFRNEYGSRIRRDENGIAIKDSQGNPVVDEFGTFGNLREKLGFFIQNGVLNTYYGAKKDERAIMAHADFVNNLLDSTHDFEILGDLIAANKGAYSSNSKGDTMTMQYVRAFRTMESLEKMGNDEKDPFTLSSVVQKAKDYIERAATLDKEDSNSLDEQELKRVLGQYYANNNISQSDEHDAQAISYIAQNARELQKAYEDYKKADKEIDSLGISIPEDVRSKMRLNKAITGHWEDRVESMRGAINDSSDVDGELAPENILPSYGGIKGAEAIVKVYNRQEEEIKLAQETQRKQTAKLEDSYRRAKEATKKAPDGVESYKARLKEAVAKANLEDSKMQEEYLDDLLFSTQTKRDKIQAALDSHEKGTSVKVLTADEIFNLDPITRARMLDSENRTMYSKAQRKELSKLEERLLHDVDEGGDAYQKVMDIALLLQRVRTNKDAYSRMAKNPKAAAANFERQRVIAARNAYRMINKRNAEVAASYIDAVKKSLSRRKDITKKDIDNFVYKVLRTLNSEILDNIDEDGILSENQRQLLNAKEWSKTLSDITTIVLNSDKSDEYKANLLRNILANLVDDADTREELMTDLENAIDSLKAMNKPESDLFAKDLEDILQEMEKLGYQRDKAVIESREERIKREEEQKKRDEAAKQRIDDATEEAGRQAEQRKDEEQNNTAQNQSQEQKKVFKSNDDAVSSITLEDMIKLFPESFEGMDDATREMLERDPSVMVPQLQKNVERTVDYLNGEMSAKDYMSDIMDDGELATYSPEGLEETAKERAKRFTPYIVEVNQSDNQAQENSVPDVIQTEPITPKKSPQELLEGKEEGATTAGNITTGTKENPQKGTLTVVKSNEGENSTITFEVQPVGEKAQPTTITITPETYEVPKESKEDNAEEKGESAPKEEVSKEDKPFNVKSIEKKDGETILNGTFAGETTPTQVKAKKNFNLTEAVEQHRENENARMAAEGVEVNDDNIKLVGEGDNQGVMVVSSTLEAQAQQLQEQGIDVSVASVDNIPDAGETNTVGEALESTSPYLSANSMERYKMDKLRGDRKVEYKEGAVKHDAMDDFFRWLEGTGTKLQEIIDNELFQLLAEDPHMKIKFMVANPRKQIIPSDNEEGVNIGNRLMLVIDYTDKVHNIHKKYKNGGVIEINEGNKKKKYLLVGVVGYGRYTDARNKEKMAHFQNLWWAVYDHDRYKEHRGLIAQGMETFFRNNPTESFYVRDDIYTEVVPGSLIPGYLVRQLQGDTESPYRPISTLINDDTGKRNPNGVTWDNIGWMIQEKTKFISVKAKEDEILWVENWEDRAGNTFALVPASNGKKIAIYIKPMMLNELWQKDSRLKKEIENLLDIIGNPNVNRDEKVKALIRLSKRIYISDTENGDTILIGKFNDISVYKRGDKIPIKFHLNTDTYSLDEFKNTILAINPIINITAEVISNNDTLQMYDEAGALNTNVARLGTMGSRYSIFPVGSNGKPLGLEAFEGSIPDTDYQGFEVEKKKHISYGNGEYYATKDGVFYYSDGTTVIEDIPANARLLRDLEYNRRIIEGELQPVNLKNREAKDKGYDYYILNVGEHPEVIKVKDKDYRVEVLSEEESKEYIQKYTAEKSQEERDAAAETKVDDLQKEEQQQQPTQALGEGVILNPTTGQLEVETGNAEEGTIGQKEGSENNTTQPISSTPPAALPVPAVETTQDILSLLVNRKWGRVIDDAISNKWPDAPDDDADLVQFLKNKGVNTDSIGTSDEAIKAWIKTIEECR